MPKGDCEQTSHFHRRNLLRQLQCYSAKSFKVSQRGNTQVQSPQKPEGLSLHDTQTGMPSGIPEGASCVQRFDDSLNSAIHITYRISLRSSSMREPRDPLLKVLFYYNNNVHYTVFILKNPKVTQFTEVWNSYKPKRAFTNDPSAGSPTETLLRLLLPLNDQV